MDCTTTEKKVTNITTPIIFLIIAFLISPDFIISQTQLQTSRQDPRVHNETKDDDYIPVSRESQGRSPAYNYSLNEITTVQVNVDANGLNIVGDAANEPSIAVNPVDRNKMAIGWRQFNTVTSNFRQAGYGFTTDNGAS